MAELCFEGPEEQLRLTEFTQPAIFTVSVAALRVLAEAGVTADYLAGHSLGEYSANVAAGVDRICHCGPHGPPPRAVDAASSACGPRRHGGDSGHAGGGCGRRLPGCIARDGAPVEPANLNSPEQTVISGAVAAVERAAALAKERGAKRAVLLQVSAPFHCSLMQPAQDALAPILEEYPFRSHRCRLWSTWTRRW